MCLHTVSNSSGHGQLWQQFLVPWNRPTYQTGTSLARVKANLLPGCQWLDSVVLLTHPQIVDVGGGTNEVGIGGALYCTQNAAMYYLETYNGQGGITSQLPENRELPTFSTSGRDTTEWERFLLRSIMLKGDPAVLTFFLYTYKVHFTFLGVSLSQAAGLHDESLVYHDP